VIRFPAIQTAKCTVPVIWVKFMDNGEIECLGRVDAQNKIRGYRIEAGEIEISPDYQYNIKEAVVLPDQIKMVLINWTAYIVIKDTYQAESESSGKGLAYGFKSHPA